MVAQRRSEAAGLGGSRIPGTPPRRGQGQSSAADSASSGPAQPSEERDWLATGWLLGVHHYPWDQSIIAAARFLSEANLNRNRPIINGHSDRYWAEPLAPWAVAAGGKME